MVMHNSSVFASKEEEVQYLTLRLKTLGFKVTLTPIVPDAADTSSSCPVDSTSSWTPKIPPPRKGKVTATKASKAKPARFYVVTSWPKHPGYEAIYNATWDDLCKKILGQPSLCGTGAVLSGFDSYAEAAAHWSTRYDEDPHSVLTYL